LWQALSAPIIEAEAVVGAVWEIFLQLGPERGKPSDVNYLVADPYHQSRSGLLDELDVLVGEPPTLLEDFLCIDFLREAVLAKGSRRGTPGLIFAPIDTEQG
jgi:hypothetical protein